MRLSAPSAVVVAMLGGAIFGWTFPAAAAEIAWVSEIFLRLIRSIIAPLLFAVIVKAIADAGPGGLGRLGWRSLLYFEITNTIALLLGWAAVALLPTVPLLQPAPAAKASETRGLASFFADAVPTSILDAMARGDVVQILVFCLLFGAAAGATKAPAVVRFAAALTSICFAFTRYAMYLAPAAVFAAMARTVATSAGDAVFSLAGFIASAWLAETLFVLTVIGLSVRLAGLPLRRFAAHVKEPFLVAFATTSSAASMPKTLEAMERLGVSRDVYGIVAPLSLSLNLSGSTIYLAMCSFFAARAAAIDLSLASQLLLLAMLKLTSRGVAGIPRANFVILTGVFAAFDLPAGILTILLGVDALVDPFRTSTNVLSHCAAPPLIERWNRRATRCGIMGRT